MSLGYNDNKAGAPAMWQHPGRQADRFGRSDLGVRRMREPFASLHEAGEGVAWVVRGGSLRDGNRNEPLTGDLARRLLC
jgi:hypothetical protein